MAEHDGWTTSAALEASAVALGLRVLSAGRVDEEGAAALLGRSVGRLRNMRSKREGPAYIKAAGVTYPFLSLARFLNAGYVCTADWDTDRSSVIFTNVHKASR